MTKRQQALTDEEMDELMEEAELKAESDMLPEDTVSDEPMSEKEAIEAVQENDEDQYTVKFLKEYEYEGKKISSVDMKGLDDLTTRDMEVFDRILAKMQHSPADKYRDTTYTKHIAVRVTGLPIEFFNQLKARDMLLVTARVYSYFLYGWEQRTV